MAMDAPLNICVTGAAGQIAYSLVHHICSGYIFGEKQIINLHLLDIPVAMEALKGVVMEIEDCAYQLLNSNIIASPKVTIGVQIYSDPMLSFKDCDVAFLVGAMPRKQGMQRKDLLIINAGIFREQGKAIDAVAKKSVKILVVGNPANTNAFITRHYAPSLTDQNISALTRLDLNRSKAQISSYLKLVNPLRLKNFILWGNHSNTQYPDVSHAFYVDENGNKISVLESITDKKYLYEDFVATVQNRGAAVINARKLSSALSAAKAVADHMKDWWNGTPKGEFVSMAVPSDGSYGIPKGVIYSFPVVCENKKWKIVDNLSVDEVTRKKMDISLNELLGEKKDALEYLASHL